MDSCVRGYHFYGDIWTPSVGDILSCEEESDNSYDEYAVAIKDGATVIGHVPRKISAACSLFIGLGGVMNCLITDNHRRYSADLPQGGLEIPCKIAFQCGDSALMGKLKKLVKSVPSIEVEVRKRSKSEQKNGKHVTKKIKVEDAVDSEVDARLGVLENSQSVERVWLKFDRRSLTMADLNMIVKGLYGVHLAIRPTIMLIPGFLSPARIVISEPLAKLLLHF